MSSDFKDEKTSENKKDFVSLWAELCSRYRKEGEHSATCFTLFSDLTDFFSEVVIRNNRTIDLLTFKDAVKALVDNKPDNPSVAKAALIRRKISASETEVIFTYLDRNDWPVERQHRLSNSSGRYSPRFYDFVKTVKAFDSELTDLFGEENLIIVECF